MTRDSFDEQMRDHARKLTFSRMCRFTEAKTETERHKSFEAGESGVKLNTGPRMFYNREGWELVDISTPSQT